MDITALLARLPLAGNTGGANPTADATSAGGASFTDTLLAAIGGRGEVPAVPAAVAADPAAGIPQPTASAVGALALAPIAAGGSPAPEDTPVDTSGEDSDGDDEADGGEITQAILLAAPATDTRGTAAPVKDGGAEAAPPQALAPRPADRDLPRRDTAAQALPADAEPVASRAPAPGADRPASIEGMAREAAVTEGPAVNGGGTADSPSPSPATSTPGGIASVVGAAQAAPAQPPATAAATSLQAPVASPAWGQELGHQLVALAQRGEDRVELHLNPRELGPLSVSLTVDDQGARAQFFSAHAPVRGAVEQALPQLREALAQQGIALGETSVGEQQQHFRQDTPGGWSSAASGNPASEGEAGAETSPATRAIAAPGNIAGGVDLYA